MLQVGTVISLPVTAGTLDTLTDALLEHAISGRAKYVCAANAHMLVTARRQSDLRQVVEKAEFVTSDGMPLVWALRFQGLEYAERVYGPDLMIRLCEAAQQHGLGIYLLGGIGDTLKRLQMELHRRFPRLDIAGVESPRCLPEKPAVDPATVDRIRLSRARLVFVGLGCPKQEYWMAAYSPHLDAVLIGVGAAFDYYSGEKSQAPRWMQKNGLEWIFRLLTEPRRLWKRYLITNISFIGYWINDWVKAITSRHGAVPK